MKSKRTVIRKIHRYLGLFIGIQFLGWTVGGLYFTWTDLDKVHGDHLRKTPHFLPADIEVVSPSVVIRKLREQSNLDAIHSIQLIHVSGQPIYQVSFFSRQDGDTRQPDHVLADAATGNLRGALTREEAITVARDHVRDGAHIADIALLEQTAPGDEYREKPLPAWAIKFDDPACTVYVSASLGTFQSIRHDQWRVFDWLWMIHTMDFYSRDNFNNWLVRIFSVLGLTTVLSGFMLFFATTTRRRTGLLRTS